MKWYLAGPMSGIPQFNIPLFDEVTEKLRSHGYDIVSPAELDTPEIRAAAMQSESGQHSDLPAGDTWGTLLARDVHIIADEIDGIIFLPKWHESNGARLEAYVALITGKKFAEYRRGSFQPLDPQVVADFISLRIVKTGHELQQTWLREHRENDE